MRCDDARDRLLDPEVEPHLATCGACRAEAERLRRTWSSLDLLPDEEPDSAALRPRIEAAIARHRLPRPASGWWQVAALLAAFAGGALLGVVMRTATPREPGLTAIRGELEEMRALLTLSLMRQTAAAERLHGVRSATGLVSTRPDVVSALLEGLRRDPDVNVRLATIRALERVGAETAVRDSVVTALEREESPLVSIALVDFVVSLRHPPAVPALRRVAEDPERDDAVRTAAATAIDQLTEGGL